MENAAVSAYYYIASLEQRLSALTAERDSVREEVPGLSQELQGLLTPSERLSSERDNLQGVVEKMQRELRNLRRMLFGCRSERFIPEDSAQLKLSFEGVEELDEEREPVTEAQMLLELRNENPSLKLNVLRIITYE